MPQNPPPNPSIERTSLSWPRKAVVHLALRGQPKAAAHVERYVAGNYLEYC